MIFSLKKVEHIKGPCYALQISLQKDLYFRLTGIRINWPGTDFMHNKGIIYS